MLKGKMDRLKTLVDLGRANITQRALKERGIDKLLDEAREDFKENDATLLGKKKCKCLHLCITPDFSDTGFFRECGSNHMIPIIITCTCVE